MNNKEAMRTMVNSKTKEKLKIKEHIILKNFWEYYVIEDSSVPKMKDIEFCLVMGLEQELGDVYIPEIEPYIISRTKKLQDIMPAQGYRWDK